MKGWGSGSVQTPVLKKKKKLIMKLKKIPSGQ
jgi:hypothetical protein